MVNPNAWYIAMHLDRLSEELITNTYGKQEDAEIKKKKRKAKINIENNLHDDEKEK